MPLDRKQIIILTAIYRYSIIHRLNLQRFTVGLFNREKIHSNKSYFREINHRIIAWRSTID